jgi:hypothetical protein
MSSIPLPALDVKPPQPIDPLASFQRLMALKQMGQQQQMQQMQMQSQQQEQQLRQQQIQDQQSVMQYLRSNPSSTYGDAANALKGKISLPAYTNLVDLDAKITQQHAQATQAQLDVGDKVHTEQQRIYNNAANLSDKDLATQWPTIANSLNSIPGTQFKVDPAQPMTGDQLKQHGVALGLQEAYLKQEQDKRKEQAETAEAQGKGAEAQATADQKRQESQFYQNSGLGAPGVPAETAEMVSALRQNPGLTPGTYPAWKAAQVSTAELPARVATASAEGQARQLVEGMEKPVYAVDPKTGQQSLMSATDALKSGIRTMLPVTASQVENDTKLINRLGDVRQKISEYEQTLQKPISDKDQGNIAALLGTQGAKLGAFGTEIPMDRVNAALNRENLQGLSANARDQIVAYKNAREAMMGYKTVLSGSARGSDKSMDLLTQALPDPSITDPDFSKRSLDAFKQNLGVVGQGLPKIPGVKSPEEIEAQTKPKQQPSTTSAPGAFDWNAMPQHQQ